jgi:hypothetical protein
MLALKQKRVLNLNTHMSMHSYRRLCILIVVYVFLLFVHVSYRCLCILIVVHVFLDTATLTGFSMLFPRL